MKPVYLDYNATTPIDPEVAEAMQPYLIEHFGNPSSSHWYGQRSKQAVEAAWPAERIAAASRSAASGRRWAWTTTSRSLAARQRQMAPPMSPLPPVTKARFIGLRPRA